jgi:tripartite-type tricarboxylate transporter receptor subunit TctC
MRVGTHHSPAVRQRMSDARRKALADPAVRQRMSDASRKALADPAVRQRMSDARRKALADPAVRQRMSDASRKAWADPAVRQRMNRRRDDMKDFCLECVDGNCLACDGHGCKCPCGAYLDKKRIPPQWYGENRQTRHGI